MFGETDLARNNYEIVSTRRRRQTTGTCSEKEKKKTTRGCQSDATMSHEPMFFKATILVTRPCTKSRIFTKFGAVKA